MGRPASGTDLGKEIFRIGYEESLIIIQYRAFLRLPEKREEEKNLLLEEKILLLGKRTRPRSGHFSH
jgi:hypothetical protein